MPGLLAVLSPLSLSHGRLVSLLSKVGRPPRLAPPPVTGGPPWPSIAAFRGAAASPSRKPPATPRAKHPSSPSARARAASYPSSVDEAERPMMLRSMLSGAIAAAKLRAASVHRSRASPRGLELLPGATPFR
jgi:hypothetical protein